MNHALVLDNVKKTYDDGKEALRGITLSIDKGEFFALLGPNGAGKSTLIGIVCGLVKKSGGKVTLLGHDIDHNHDKAKVRVGLVPQEFNANIFEKVEDILYTQAGYYGISRSEAKEQIDWLLRELGLEEKRHSKSMTLSGGMKRRLLIARGLVHKPEFLFLDEPTAGVDVELRLMMWDFLRELNKKGVTIVLTTHYLEEAEKLCKRMAIISKGQVQVEGDLAHICAGRSLEEVYLEKTK
jgi:ABC-2 type transport system ATP-binding protein